MHGISSKTLKNKIAEVLESNAATTLDSASVEQLYSAVATVIRELLSGMYRKHNAHIYGEGEKRVYYLCMEFLLGRSLRNNISNLCLEQQMSEIMNEIGVPLDTLYEQEPDAGLGNGGLGRLAACYLDALAHGGYGAAGYSILYEYGIFKQQITDGWQQELADNWLDGGSVWIHAKPAHTVEVKFGGELREEWYDGFHHVEQYNCDIVRAVPYDMYVSGYSSNSVSPLRLWRAEAPGIDMDSFVRGDYAAAMHKNNDAELISKVLYPNDEHLDGKILRLRQQYFLCCASISDIVRRHVAQYGTLENLPDKVAIHINDTHPTLAIPELMRVLLDECGYGWDRAYDIVCRTFSYTNHTILSEALECWGEEMFRKVLPRIYQIIEEMDSRLVTALYERYPGDSGKVEWMRFLSGGVVKMANICVAVCHAVNGVSALHSEIIKKSLFSDYYDYAPDKFTNVTNGIAYRRWLLQGNERLTQFLSATIGDGFMQDANELVKLAKFADDPAALAAVSDIKRANKERLAEYILKKEGIAVDCSSMFDVQAKRLHEYKRQHLNALHILRQYLDLKENPTADFVPRTYIFGAKAASGYYLAKQIIRFIWAIGQLCESDPAVRDKLKVVFLQDYRVTLSELLIPATEISEQISLAGKEASGTGNMKFMMNGAVTLGTLDGANVEILDAVGEDNFILFGMTAPEVELLRAEGYLPKLLVSKNPRLKQTLDFVSKGFCSKNFPDLVNNLMLSDPYMVLADFDSYCAAQRRADALYKDPVAFSRMSLMNTAYSGIFSADRSVKEYAENIWHIRPVK